MFEYYDAREWDFLDAIPRKSCKNDIVNVAMSFFLPAWV
jgi:hypothetical protein